MLSILAAVRNSQYHHPSSSSSSPSFVLLLFIIIMLLSHCLARKSVTEHCWATSCGLGCSAPSVLSLTVFKCLALFPGFWQSPADTFHVVGHPQQFQPFTKSSRDCTQCTNDYWNDQDRSSSSLLLLLSLLLNQVLAGES